jgi:hypothetical protein
MPRYTFVARYPDGSAYAFLAEERPAPPPGVEVILIALAT